MTASPSWPAVFASSSEHADRREQTRARYPDVEGYAERDGVRVFYEVYGSGERTILLLPTWSIIHSRFWKAQIPYLARHFRVVTFDGRGNGRSDRPVGAEAYSTTEFAGDALIVMDATATDRAALIGQRGQGGIDWDKVAGEGDRCRPLAGREDVGGCAGLQQSLAVAHGHGEIAARPVGRDQNATQGGGDTGLDGPAFPDKYFRRARSLVPVSPAFLLRDLRAAMRMVGTNHQLVSHVAARSLDHDQ